MTRISVCIATVRPTSLGAAIRSILRQTWSEWELVVVGQGDRETLASVVRAVAQGDPRVRFVHAERRGLSVARNVGLRAAEGDVIAMTDDDCEARADWLEVLAASFAEQPELGMVGGSLLAPPEGARPLLSSWLALVPAEVTYVPAAGRGIPEGFNWVGANCAFRRTAVKRVGRFDELLGAGAPFASSEDLDYLHRLEAAGVTMRSTPRSVVSHSYGRRDGLRALVGYWRGQGTGHGAVLAKRTLAGDPRGRAELVEALRGYPLRTLARSKPGHAQTPGRRSYGRLVSDAVRVPAIAAAYRRCLRDYRLDEEGLLRPRA